MQPYATYEEIRRQPETWRTSLDFMSETKDPILRFIRENQPKSVLFTGCGTSYYLSLTAARFFQVQTGIPAHAVPASEVMLQPSSVIRPHPAPLLIASSRSGETTEVVRAVEEVRRRKLARCLAVTCEPSSRLTEVADFSIPLPHTREKSVVMTGSFTNMLLALQLFAAFLSENQNVLEDMQKLPRLGQKQLLTAEEQARQTALDESRNHLIYLGLGEYYGLACEAMLKMKEMTQLFCEAYNPLEFRHGPISVLNEDCRVFLLSGRTSREYDADLIPDLRKQGSDVKVVGEPTDSLDPGQRVDLPPGLEDGCRSILYLPFFQFLAYYQTLQLKLNPDQPRNLGQVVRLGKKGE
ncbi:glucosamine--fructose-6-phosphate aminotransferase (isomerizing) [Melghirimyces profundicolus]|uniref:Glucosamine--fructose-6-phosphate aminotransferase (Isomerizing) n=1 Tax=Melghirimyces profundicolus TaxID=1242148 RepID=A0A2T6C9D2_9BACL|nr:SIS domain-containing protein [Melghirimyces profundicolus]PTX64911.1 glucosamine--fructose-6-phosphate aminotransferase (isomerizing) [Melghirimyces profundicolus]